MIYSTPLSTYVKIEDDNSLPVQLLQALHSNHQISKQILQQKQQRLLLLRHHYCFRHNYQQNHNHSPDKDDNKDDDCPLTPHCKTMKLVWYHISRCVDHQCKIPHCLSSRKILSHYKSCQHSSCPICRPVRYVIAQSNSDL